jgi:hypothetical protein
MDLELGRKPDRRPIGMAYRSLKGRVCETIEALKCPTYHARVTFEGWILEQQMPFGALLSRYDKFIHPVFMEEFGLDACRVIGRRYCRLVCVGIG